MTVNKRDYNLQPIGAIEAYTSPGYELILHTSPNILSISHLNFVAFSTPSLQQGGIWVTCIGVRGNYLYSPSKQTLLRQVYV